MPVIGLLDGLAEIPMPAYLKILLYLAAALAAGAAAAPPVFWAGQALASSGFSDWLAGFPFHRVLSRCLQVSLIVLLWPAVRWVGLRKLSELRLRANPVAVRDTTVGLLLGAVCVFLVSAVGLIAGFYGWREEIALGTLGRIVITAGAVSFVEEVVFRGVILGLCLWNLSARFAIGISSALFAVLHFLKPAKTRIAPEAVDWFSGYTELFSFIGALPSTAVLCFGLASLFVAGWILGRATVRTHSLWLAVGLHAGWVFGVQASNLFLRLSSSGPSGSLPWFGPALVSGAVPTGILPAAGLLLAGWLVQLYLKHAFRPAVA